MDATVKPQPSLLAGIPPALLLRAGAGVVAAIAVGVTAILWSQQPDWKVLYAGLSEKDGGAVIEELSRQNVPWRMAEGGGAILVPADQAPALRLRLASAGLPKGDQKGYELLDQQAFGITQFQERVHYQRALEGELVRSIESLQGVNEARVHLAIPAQPGFLRTAPKPSASVVVHLQGGFALDRQQVAGIVNLVSASIAGLDSSRVSVVDQQGHLLSARDDALGMSSTQMEYRQKFEQELTQRLGALLAPIVGASNARVQVAADLDFTQSEATQEQYAPNQGTGQGAIRSQQSTETEDGSGGGNRTAQGLPGAMSNQPAPTGNAAVNGTAQKTEAATDAGVNGNGAAGTQSRHRENTTNFEVDRTVRVTRQPTPQVKRLSVAILVNERSVTAEDGKVTRTPLTEAELTSIRTLVKDAAGLLEPRGDTLAVVSAPFVEEKVETVELPAWKDPQNQALARDLMRILGPMLVVLLMIFGVVRPALRAIAASREQQAEQATAASLLSTTVDDPLLLPDPNGTSRDVGQYEALSPEELAQRARVERLSQFATENPAAVAQVIRSWISQPQPVPAVEVSPESKAPMLEGTTT